MTSLKVVTVVGTRPEIIRLSRVISILDEYTSHTLIHTGQNYDYELSEVFFENLELRQPDRYLNVRSSTLGETLAGIIRGIEDVLVAIKPDAFLVLGDTNSAVSILIAKRMKIPTYHMEAGNRSFDANVPEEVNRKMVDHLSDYNLVYTEHARRNLRSEGLHDRFIYKTGSPMLEVLTFYKTKIDKSSIVDQLNLTKNEYVVVSVHREENVDDLGALKSVVLCLNGIWEEFKIPVVVSLHPRTSKRLEALQGLRLNENIKLEKPFSFTDYVKLQKDSFCTVSDSGTISEESSILDFPAVTIRSSMERPEAMDAGSIIITGLEAESVIRCIRLASESQKKRSTLDASVPEDYLISNTSERVAKIILGTTPLTLEWKNMRQFSRYQYDL